MNPIWRIIHMHRKTRVYGEVHLTCSVQDIMTRYNEWSAANPKLEALALTYLEREKWIVYGPFMIEMKFVSGWGDAEWTEDDKPLRFTTIHAAQTAINEHISRSKEAAKRKDIDEPHNPDDYRVVVAYDTVPSN